MKKTKNSTPSKGLAWPELIPGILVKRYKRFMADVKLADGEVVTAHCPNSGSMRECCEPGRPVHLSFHDNPKRKLKYTWELIEMPTSIVGINTLIPNRLVAESIKAGLVSDLNGYDNIVREVKTSDNTRLDILLSSEDGNRCYVEIRVGFDGFHQVADEIHSGFDIGVTPVSCGMNIDIATEVSRYHAYEFLEMTDV